MATGCETDTSPDCDVCLRPDLVCRREQKGLTGLPPHGGLAPTSQWPGSGRITEGEPL